MNISPKVVDLSHHNTVTDWHAVRAAGIRGIINKATEGAGFTDPTFTIRRTPATAAGLLFGGYHFLKPGDIAAQVDYFLAATAPHDGLLLAVDHETPGVSLADLKDFVTQFRLKVGRYPVLYSGFLIKEQLGTAHDALLAQCPLWLSHYSNIPKWPPCWPSPWLWQFTGDGTGPLPHAVPGIAGTGIDIDSFAGTDDELSQQWPA